MCVYMHFSGEGVFGFAKFSVGSLSQEKSRAATLSEVQDIVQNLDPSNHSLNDCYPSYRHESGLPCSLAPLIHFCPSLHPVLGQGAIQEEGAVL